MLTATTPCAASACSGYSGAPPRTIAPPWIHTITGSGRADAAAGRQTLIVRQSSDFGISPACRHDGPNAAASLTPVHAGTGCGMRQRSAPTGAAA